MDFITSQLWRYATKKFDPNQKISSENITLLQQAIQLSTSSYGLQPYKVFIITNPDIRVQLLPYCWNQQQVVDASHLFIFAAMTDISDDVIDTYIALVSKTRNIPLENLQGYSTFMKTKINALTTSEKEIWAAKQTYLALGNLLNAAADLKIDATPMEGFEPEKINNLLNLTQQGLTATLLAPVGYRDNTDTNQFLNKVRKPFSELFIEYN